MSEKGHHISPMNSLTMPGLMILLSYASLHTLLMPFKASYLAPAQINTDSSLLALDVLGFSQFKHSYAQILNASLQTIEKPFLKPFAAENIKKSF